MIPTTLSASPSSSSSIGNAGGGASNPNSLANTTTKELVVGIASLILEGRAFVDDEFHMLSIRQATPSPPRAQNPDSDHSQMFTATAMSTSMSTLSSDCVGVGVGVGVAGGGGGGGGRQSPKPSTSKTATAASVQHLINITTNPQHGYGAQQQHTAPLFIETPISYHSSSSAASSAESTHQRWTQKLCQLRQASPAASLTAPYEQKIAVEAAQMNSVGGGGSGGSGGTGGEPELVSLAIHGSNATAERGSFGGEFEIVRRVMLSRSILPMGGTAATSTSLGAGCVSASSSPSSGSDNFLHSLQSLATTCLRGSSPSMDTPTSGCHYAAGSTSSRSSGYASMVSPKYAAYRASTPRFHSPFARNLDLHQPGSASSSGSGVQSPKMSSSAGHSRTKDFSMRQGSKAGRLSTPTSTMTSGSSASVSNLASKKTLSSLLLGTPPKVSPALSSSSSSYPQQGPHCDQFLRKMGLAKGETAEAEDHYCDMSYVNITCSRWRAYCLKMEAIIERCKPICIEVYLGPVGHKVLLEQWIFTFKEKLPPPTMSLPSLCSAIRSQLYFSQISAWCDLIRKSDKSIYDTGRVIFANSLMMGCAGDLATSTPTTPGLSCTPPGSALPASAGGATGSNTIHASTTPLGTLPSTSTSTSTSTSMSTSTSIDQITNAMFNQRPRLNLFYRVKQYDATACFNSKPTIHNFPNVNISENCSISVCLKSLPRINGGIPKLGTMMSIPNENQTANIGRSPLVVDSSTKILNNEPSLPKEKLPLPACSNGGGGGGGAGGLVAAPSKAGADAASSAASINSVSNNSAALLPNCDKSKMYATGASPMAMDGNSAANNAKMQQNRFSNNLQLMKAKIDLDGETPCSSSSSSSAMSQRYEPTQKCTFFIDECELSLEHCGGTGTGAGAGAGEANADAYADAYAYADGDGDADADDMSDFGNDAQCSNGSCGSLSHREKQLLKYRKRMLKRDKKQQQQHQQQRSCHSSSSVLSSLPSSFSGHQPMEQGEDDENGSEHSSTGLLTVRHVTKMISTGTQTPEHGCCQRCGNDKSLVCLKCNDSSHTEDNPPSEDHAMGMGMGMGMGMAMGMGMSMGMAMGMDEMDASSVNSLSSSEIITTPRSKGDLLLQAIQRTPKAAKHKQKAQRSNGTSTGGDNSSSALIAKLRCTAATSNAILQTNNNHLSNTIVNGGKATENGVTPSSSNSSLASLGSGCQVCKRQKTQHNFGFDNGVAANNGNAKIEDGKRDGAGVATGDIDVDVDAEDDEQREGGKVLSALSCALQNDGQEEINKTPSKAAVAMPRSCTSIEIMDEECFVSSTKLTPHFDRCALSSARSVRPITPTMSVPLGKSCTLTLCQSRHAAPPSAPSGKRTFTPPTPLQLNVDCEFKTPNVGADIKMPFQHKVTSKPNLLEVVCTYRQEEMKICCGSSGGCSNSSVAATQDYHNSLLMRKGLPKVNLTPIFCNSSSGNSFGSDFGGGGGGGGGASGCCDSPSPDSMAFSFDSVTINRVKFERAATAAAAAVPSAKKISAPTNNNINSNSNSNSCSSNNNKNNNNTATAIAIAFDNSAVPVQKSYSAPTLPNSPSLSPRFAKQAAIYKRRSRHLSDRSDRSSLGSDEQYSDEDLDIGSGRMLMTPGLLYNSNVRGGAASPMKHRSRLAGMFNRQPLLGNLEECLLQNRIAPKTEVNGFKVLLGASGGFCPTQLTIPAAAYFYELHGETLSTPYVCEIRLPRKGYSVPRIGTIQATLLNPLGTVVRMFVIPYDMRDMPPLHQTFIRQRILADSSAFSPSTNVGATTACSSMESNSALADGNMEYIGDGDGDGDGGSNSNVSDNSADAEVQKLGHFISSEHMKRLRYSIHLRFQTSRSGRLLLHTDIRLLISRRTDCDTAAAHAKGLLEAPNELITDTVMPSNPKYSVRQDVSCSGAAAASSRI